MPVCYSTNGILHHSPISWGLLRAPLLMIVKRAKLSTSNEDISSAVQLHPVYLLIPLLVPLTYCRNTLGSPPHSAHATCPNATPSLPHVASRQYFLDSSMYTHGLRSHCWCNGMIQNRRRERQTWSTVRPELAIISITCGLGEKKGIEHRCLAYTVQKEDVIHARRSVPSKGVQ